VYNKLCDNSLSIDFIRKSKYNHYINTTNKLNTIIANTQDKFKHDFRHTLSI